MKAYSSAGTLAGLVATGLIAMGAAVSAVELPIRGEFGDPTQNGCRSLKANEEGAFVVFERGGRIGQGGEGGCDFSKVEKTSANSYKLTGICFQIDGPKSRTTARLTVVGKDEIVFDTMRYIRCK